MLEQNLRTTPLGSACAPIPHCPMVAPRYRRIDGACNNLYNPAWGSSLTAYSRLLPPMYQDGEKFTRSPFIPLICFCNRYMGSKSLRRQWSTTQ